jgi:hypothetical protein
MAEPALAPLAPRHGEPLAAHPLEWLVPTGVILFVASKYIGAILSEAGKEHYPIVRDAVVRALTRLRGAQVVRVESVPGKS